MVPALTLAGAGVIALWMAGAIYYDVCGGAKWGRWVAVAWAAGVVALFAVWQPLWQPIVALLGVAAAVPRLVAPAEAEPRPRLGPERGRAAAGRPRRGRGHDRERPQLRIPLARRFHAALREPHRITSRICAAWTSFSSTGARALDEPPRAGLRLRAGRPHLHVDRGAVPQGAEVLGPPQPLPAAGADLRRRRRARRRSCGARSTASAKRRTCTASSRRSRSCGPRSSITSRRSTTCTRSPAGTTACARTAPPSFYRLPSSRSAGTGA